MFDPESLLQPLTEDAPCGADLEYDPAFLELEVAGAGKPEQEYGDTKIPAKPPDWAVVVERGLDLARRTRDLRVAGWLIRAGAHSEGWGAVVEGLRLLQGLLARHWASVHPQLDAADANSPLMRLSALSPLSPQESPYPAPPIVLEDLRAARLAPERGSMTVRDVELGMGAAEPLGDEAKPTEAGVLDGLQALASRHPGLLDSMVAGAEAMAGVQQVLVEHLGAQAPDLNHLRKLLDALAMAARRARGESPAAHAGVPVAATAAAAAGAIASREDVSRTIDRLCEWIERNEPSNPAPLLLRRAQRLLTKNFLDIMRDIAPDSVDQVLRLAGSENTE